MSEAFIILGDQLFPISHLEDHKKKFIFMAEDQDLATHYKYHKHKIAFFFLSMRTYADELKSSGLKVTYEKLTNEGFLKRLREFTILHKIKKISMFEIQDKFFEKELTDFFINHDLSFEFLDSPMFLCPRSEFKKYLSTHKKPFMKSFYEQERKRLGVLLEKGERPVGGQWSFDVENRKKAPKELTNVGLSRHKVSPDLEEVSKLIEEKFSAHPGSMKNFWLPTDREGALHSLKHFIQHHLTHFGDYQDAITNRDPFLYHSIISPMMNNGLITADEILLEVIEAFENRPDIPLSSVEGFIRQVMGWREFVRGIYQNFSDVEESSNFFKHKGKLTKDWYEGTTGLPPVDDAIKKANEFGYCHHIERLMILSNIMLLTEMDPQEVHKWFMEMFVDSADWVMGPNVYGMGQFSDGGIFATKPYISGSNYILKMSDYKKGEWCDVWDGLFWRFVGKNSTFLSKNHRMNMMVKLYEKMDPVKKKKLLGLAQDFIDSKSS